MQKLRKRLLKSSKNNLPNEERRPMQLTKTMRELLDAVEQEINRIQGYTKVPVFYEPIKYFISLKGKRVRPLLTMLSAKAIDAEDTSSVFPAAAVELLHNFTLVHDDIMDNDDTRRGKPTVHKRWDISTAILAGDGLMGFAFDKLLHTPQGDVAAMARRFAQTMIVICEGQGLDKMFEAGHKVTLPDYMDMIKRKTSVLLELACELGGMTAGADENQLHHLRNFGYELGMGFQIQDDLLDIMADQDQFGKAVGSDLSRHKQTILTLLLQEQGVDIPDVTDVGQFRQLIDQYAVVNRVQDIYLKHFYHALSHMQNLPDNEATRQLNELAVAIRDRQW
ncbi:MAG: polyprenyl synthetase family protein [Caldithrix sp.]|nr:polyprenyl synthetase family protein [Caldithrix sp.]